LYGDRPEIGIRELLQNSVDAVRELLEYQKKDNKDIKLRDLEDDADVEIVLERNENNEDWLTISDRGIGMTDVIIREYFLKAGASFRNSQNWSKDFVNDEGKSKVLRSGRFGIGALATFLLGDEIIVQTRHVNSTDDMGIEFNATIDTETIELKKTEGLPIGTTIKVRLRKGVASRLSNTESENAQKSSWTNWDWYCLEKPKVVRRVKDKAKAKKLKQQYTFPSEEDDIMSHLQWRRISRPDYPCIDWTYKYSGLVCNGIKMKIHTDGSSVSFKDNKKQCHLGEPSSISVFDPDGNLPLTIQRDSLITNTPPFTDNLYEDICKGFIAYLLVNVPNNSPFVGNLYNSHNIIDFLGIYRLVSYKILVCTNKGISILDYSILNDGGIKYIISTVSKSFKLKEDFIDSIAIVSFYEYSRGDKVIDNDLKGAVFLGEAREVKRTSIIIEFQDPHSKEQISLYVLHKDDFENSTNNSYDFSEGFLEINRIEEKEAIKTSTLADIWMRYLGEPFIPYDPDERRRRFPKAYEELKTYIATHEKLKEQREKEK
ncbi:MAG: ATP-binding protein, partial [Nitrospirae bacterium]|nr:ATP-binding protein [Nitrospirota bacterium]